MIKNSWLLRAVSQFSSAWRGGVKFNLPLLQRIVTCQSQCSLYSQTGAHLSVRLWHDRASLSTALRVILWFYSRRWWDFHPNLRLIWGLYVIRWSPGISAVSAQPSTWLLQPRQGSWPRWAETSALLTTIYFSDYPELTNTLPGTEGESEGFENGFFFPQPPSPNLFTEAPTPEFIGEKYNIYLLLGFSRLY